MAVTLLPRLNVPQWSAGADPWTRAQTDDAFANIDRYAARGEQGPLNQLAAPGAPGTSTATVGGTLVPGTYGYRITALGTAQGSFDAGETAPSPEATRVVPAGTNTNTVTLTWAAVPGAAGYRVYGRTVGGETLLATLGNVLTYTDTGAVAPAGALPATNTTPGRPAPAIRDRFYFATDDRGGKLSYDTGAAWVEIGPAPWKGPQTGSAALVVPTSSSAVGDSVAVIAGQVGQTGPLLSILDPTLTTTLLQVSAAGIVQSPTAGASPGTTHESNRVAGVSQFYGRGLAVNNDGAAYQGGVTAGISVAVSRFDPAASISNASTGSLLQLYNGATQRVNFQADGRVGINQPTPGAYLEVRGAWGNSIAVGNLRLSRSTPATDAQSLNFAAGVAVNYIVGRKPNDDGLYFGTDGGSGMTDRALLDAAGGLSAGQRLAVGQVGARSDTRLYVQSGGGGLSEHGLWVDHSPNAGYVGLYIKSNWSTGSGGNPLQVSNASGQLFAVDNVGHVQAGGTTPSVGSLDGVRFTSASILAGHDLAGRARVTSNGTATAAGSRICRVTFGQPFAATPTVVLSASTATTSDMQLYVANASTTGFDVYSAVIVGVANGEAVDFQWVAIQ